MIDEKRGKKLWRLWLKHRVQAIYPMQSRPFAKSISMTGNAQRKLSLFFIESLRNEVELNYPNSPSPAMERGLGGEVGVGNLFRPRVPK